MGRWRIFSRCLPRHVPRNLAFFRSGLPRPRLDPATEVAIAREVALLLDCDSRLVNRAHAHVYPVPPDAAMTNAWLIGPWARAPSDPSSNPSIRRRMTADALRPSSPATSSLFPGRRTEAGTVLSLLPSCNPSITRRATAATSFSTALGLAPLCTNAFLTGTGTVLSLSPSPNSSIRRRMTLPRCRRACVHATKRADPARGTPTLKSRVAGPRRGCRRYRDGMPLDPRHPCYAGA